MVDPFKVHTDWVPIDWTLASHCLDSSESGCVLWTDTLGRKCMAAGIQREPARIHSHKAASQAGEIRNADSLL